jgi:hypothetical protein
VLDEVEGRGDVARGAEDVVPGPGQERLEPAAERLVVVDDHQSGHSGRA